MMVILPKMRNVKKLVPISLILTGHVLVSHAIAQNALSIPPVLLGPVYNLTVQAGTVQFYPGNATSTAGYNGSILGPTLIMNSGDFVTLNVSNNLGETTTTHWHGMHVAAHDDGGPHTAISAGETWSPDFTVLDSASTMWYHPHLHGNTEAQVRSGLSGMILVRDQIEAAAGLPMTYGVDEFPLVLQDRSFRTNNNQFANAKMGDVMLINATLDPYLQVPAQMVRFRVVNGSSERAYNLGMSDGRSYSIVGADGGLLDTPSSVSRVLLMPGERVDVVLDLGSDFGTNVSFMSYSSEFATSIPGSLNGPGNSVLNGADFELLELQVVAQTTGAVTTLPAVIWTNDVLAEVDATVERTVVMDQLENNAFALDSQLFDHQRMDQVIFLDSVEIWTVTNATSSAHPFHVHDVQFYILDRNGVPPVPREAGKKDTVLVDAGESVRFIARFETYADPEIPYMYHCHILSHEDAGMMAQFIVVDPYANLLELTTDQTNSTLRWSQFLTTNEFTLQSSLSVSNGFADVAEVPVVVDGRNQVSLPIDNDARFFRLIEAE